MLPSVVITCVNVPVAGTTGADVVTDASGVEEDEGGESLEEEEVGPGVLLVNAIVVVNEADVGVVDAAADAEVDVTGTDEDDEGVSVVDAAADDDDTVTGMRAEVSPPTTVSITEEAPLSS